MTRLAALFARLGPDPRADAVLLHAFRADRDEAAFAELVRRHGPTVWGVCRRTLPDPADAEDAFQATFLVLVRRGPPSGCVAAWLYRVAVFTSRGLRRRNRRRRTLPLTADPPARGEPPAVDVDQLLMKLPERERAAVVLCHLHGLTQREAADRLGVPEGTLSARLSRGLKRLRQTLPAGLAVGVPAGVAEAAVTVATAGRAAGPGVGLLVAEVLRMLWLKKLLTAGLAAAAVGGLVLLLGPITGPSMAQPPATPGGRPQAQTPATMAVPLIRPGVAGKKHRPTPATRIEAFTVPAGLPYELWHKSDRPISEVEIASAATATAAQDPGNPSRRLVTGVKPGVTWLRLKDTKGEWDELALVVTEPTATRVQLVVGESIDLSLPNGKIVRSAERVSGERAVECGIDGQGATTFRMTAGSKGLAEWKVTDEGGLAWPFSVSVVDPPAKPAKP